VNRCCALWDVTLCQGWDCDSQMWMGKYERRGPRGVLNAPYSELNVSWRGKKMTIDKTC
jgi:hypothetical protein